MLKPLRVIGLSSLLVLGVLCPSPASAADFTPGDQVLVQVEAGGKDRYKGEVTEVVRGPDGTVYYAVKWDTGGGYNASNTGRFPAGRLTARDGAPRAPRPAPPVADSGRNGGAPAPAPQPPQSSGGAPSAPATPAAPGGYQRGDAVKVTMPDGKESYKGVVDEVITNPDGSAAYAVRWDTGDGFTATNSGRVPAGRLSPLGGAPRPGPAAAPVDAPRTRPRPPVSVAGTDPAPARRPAPTPPANAGGVAPPSSPPAAPRGDPPADANPAVSADDLEWFHGQWRTVLWGNSSVFEKGEQLWKQTLTYSTPGATLTITKDGYSWGAGQAAVLKGVWRKLTPKEDPTAGGKSGLMLLNGPDGKDWQVDYRVFEGKDGIRIWNAGDLWGERVGANKPQPAWAKVQFAQNDAVTVDAPSGPCPAVITKVREPDSKGIVYYEVRFTESDGGVKTGVFEAIRIHKK